MVDEETYNTAGIYEIVYLFSFLFVKGRASQRGNLHDALRGPGADRELEEGLQSDQTSQCVGLPTPCTRGYDAGRKNLFPS